MKIDLIQFCNFSYFVANLKQLFTVLQKSYLREATLLACVLFLFTLQLSEKAYGNPSTIEDNPVYQAGNTGQAPDPENARGSLTLSSALLLALRQNPSLAALRNEIQAQDGAVQQAALPPNPVFDATGENLANPALRGVDGKSLTLSLSQKILLGGKLDKATRFAELGRELAVWDYKSEHMDVAAEVLLGYVDVLRSQQVLQLADDLAKLADQMMKVVSTRVQAGAASPVDETRARVSLASVQIEQQRAMRELTAARKRLTATWGQTTAEFDFAEGQLEPTQPVPPFSLLKSHLDRNPDIARWNSEIVRRRASIAVAESQAIPDLTINLGVQQYLNTGDNALGAGISMPVPLFDRNQGTIKQAHQQFNKSLHQQKNTQISLATVLSDVYGQLTAAYSEVEILEKTVIPGAQSAYQAIEKGYRGGKFSLVDVLVAQRTLFNAEIQHLKALAGYHQAKIQIERLIGELPVHENVKDTE